MLEHSLLPSTWLHIRGLSLGDADVEDGDDDDDVGGDKEVAMFEEVI